MTAGAGRGGRLLSLASLRPLRRRDFALVWTAALVSNIGSWLQMIAVGILVTELTGQARWTGLVAAAAFEPVGVLSPVGGAIADRSTAGACCWGPPWGRRWPPSCSPSWWGPGTRRRWR